MYVFKSHMHNVYTQLWCKLGLSNSDNKRFILDNKIDTYAWGHKNLTLDVIDSLEIIQLNKNNKKL